MCLFSTPPSPPPVKPPAPPPPTPAAPPAPKPLPVERPTDIDTEETRPRVKYGRKKSQETRSRAGGVADQLRVPLNTPGGGGGLNVGP